MSSGSQNRLRLSKSARVMRAVFCVIGPIARRRILQHSMARHSTAALAVFMFGVATALLLTVMRSAGIVVAIGGVLAALVVALIVPLVVDLRRPYFRTRTDVERVLELPVLVARRRQSDR